VRISTLDTVQNWIVVFKDDKATGPWRWLTRRGFRHVLLIGYSPEWRVWVVYDPLFNGTFLQIADDTTIDAVIDGFERQGAVMLQVTTRRPAKVIWTLPPLYCVDLVKMVLGVSAWWVKTPFQLYRHLLRAHEAVGLLKPKEV